MTTQAERRRLLMTSMTTQAERHRLLEPIVEALDMTYRAQEMLDEARGHYQRRLDNMVAERNRLLGSIDEDEDEDAPLSMEEDLEEIGDNIEEAVNTLNNLNEAVEGILRQIVYRNVLGRCDHSAVNGMVGKHTHGCARG